ncbi:methionine ABC transporter ATP-binding protein [Ignatzschineria sp. LJL83]
MIQFEHIYKTYLRNGVETEALKDVSLHIEKGDIFGVIGYSGAGKSTLIRLVNDIESPSHGKVIVDGRDLSTYTPKELRLAKKNIGMIFQHFNLLETKTVAENIALPLTLNGNHSASEIHQKVDELLKFVELPDKRNSYPRELSGGQKQRIGIARALVNDPKILLCDEATSALDPQTTIAILDLLKKINKEQGVTIMMVTHQMEVVEYLCNKVAVMEKGEVIETGKTIDVFGNPQNPTTKSFVRTVIGDSIPERVLQNLDDPTLKDIYRFEFLGRSAQEPVINELILKGNVVINILFANMIEIEGNILGSTFVQMTGEPQKVEEAIAFLRFHGVRVTHEATKSDQNTARKGA